jgi:hypothetical protein
MDNHWLTREATIRRLWIAFAILLACIVLADLVVHHHAYFTLDGSFGFGAWFGFASCVLLVLAAKALGWILKRPDTYYDS